MKFLVVFALVAAASASIIPAGHPAAESPEIQEIIAAINSPNTDPGTAILLEQMLQELLGISKPEYEPIHVGPAIVDDAPVDDSISVGPGIIEPPVVELPVIDFPLPEDAVAPAPADVPAVSANSPLVQIIVNVQQQAGAIPPASPVQVVDGAEQGVGTPVEVVDTPVYDHEPVLVMDPFPVLPEPVVVAPIVVEPAVIAPEILN